ncbi:hypothetical protein AVEN_136668-1, partial [Araneus ventricosus]
MNVGPVKLLRAKSVQGLTVHGYNLHKSHTCSVLKILPRMGYRAERVTHYRQPDYITIEP